MRIKEGLKFLFSLLLMFLILAFSVGLFINTKLLNSSFYKESLSNSKYYEYLSSEVNKGFTILSISTGISQDIFFNTVNDEFLKEQTYNNINSSISYIKNETNSLQPSLDKDKLQGDIYNKLESYAKDHNIKLNSESKEQLTKVSKDFVEITENHGDLFNMDAVIKLGQFQKFRRAVALGSKVTLPVTAGIILVIAFLMLLHKENYRKSLLWIGSSFISAGIIILVPSILGLSTRIPYRIGIGLLYLKEAVQVFVLGFLNYFLMMGLSILALGALFLVLYTMIQKGSSKGA